MATTKINNGKKVIVETVMTEQEVRAELPRAIAYVKQMRSIYNSLSAGAARDAVAKSHDQKLQWIKKAQRFIRQLDMSRRPMTQKEIEAFQHWSMEAFNAIIDLLNESADLSK